MTDYDPRTGTGIPAEPVGSLPRPSWLQQAYAQYDAGEITRDQLETEQDKAADTLAKSLPMAHTPMKQAVIAPSMLALLYPLDEEIPGDTQAQFEEDLVAECEKDIRQAFAAGPARVSVDFTEGRLASERDKDPVYQLIGEQLRSDDCGFSPFSIDEKPSHGSPDFARDTAWQMISNRVEGTRLAAEKLGIG
jgi:hypothetical protein